MPFRVGERRIERRAAHTQRLRGNGDAPAVECPHGDPESVGRTAEQGVRPDADVPEHEIDAPKSADAQRIAGAGSGDARAVQRHQKRADASTARPRLRHGEHDGDVGRLGVRDPDLPAVEHVSELVEPRRRVLVGRVGAGLLLRERKGAERLARREAAQPGVLLLVGSEGGDRLRDERRVDAGDDRYHGARVRKRFERERVADIVAAAAPPGRRNRHAEQTFAGQHGDQLPREPRLLVDGLRRRRDVFGGERGDPLLIGGLVVRELENHRYLLLSEFTHAAELRSRGRVGSCLRAGSGTHGGMCAAPCGSRAGQGDHEQPCRRGNAERPRDGVQVDEVQPPEVETERELLREIPVVGAGRPGHRRGRSRAGEIFEIGREHPRCCPRVEHKGEETGASCAPGRRRRSRSAQSTLTFE